MTVVVVFNTAYINTGTGEYLYLLEGKLGWDIWMIGQLRSGCTQLAFGEESNFDNPIRGGGSVGGKLANFVIFTFLLVHKIQLHN